MKIVYLTLLFISMNIYPADKYLYVLGGGGDPAGTSTMFDDEVKSFSKFSKNSEWKTEVYFDGGHSNTEQILNNEFSSRYKGDFVKNNYDILINDLKNKILNNQIKAGDQLMIILNTHGAANNENENTHSVALGRSSATDLNKLAGANLISIDTLNEVLKLAENKGVKLAFVDESCHSGNSFNLKLDYNKSCLVTATGKNQLGFVDKITNEANTNPTSFISRFNQGLKKGENLENVFLKSRVVNDLPDFPMISTPEGMEIQNLLYKLMEPYLKYNNESVKKFGQEYNQETIKDLACNNYKNYNQLTNLIDSLVMMREIPLSLKEFESLKKSLNEYRKYQIAYEKSFLNLKSVSDKILNELKNKFPNEAKYFADTNGISLIENLSDSRVKYYEEKFNNSKIPKIKQDWGVTYEQEKTKLKIRTYLKNSLTAEDLRKISENSKSIEENSKTFDLAKQVSKDLKNFYQAMYKANKAKEGNPCRDFTL